MCLLQKGIEDEIKIRARNVLPSQMANEHNKLFSNNLFLFLTRPAIKSTFRELDNVFVSLRNKRESLASLDVDPRSLSSTLEWDEITRTQLYTPRNPIESHLNCERNRRPTYFSLLLLPFLDEWHTERININFPIFLHVKRRVLATLEKGSFIYSGGWDWAAFKSRWNGRQKVNWVWTLCKAGRAYDSGKCLRDVSQLKQLTKSQWTRQLYNSSKARQVS